MFHTCHKALVIAAVIFSLFSFTFAYSGGSGEPNDPYQIANVSDLLELAADTNDYNDCFILINDINMDGQVFTTAIIAADTGSSSGFQGTAFTGTFDGNDHSVFNLTVDANETGGNFLGLFGWIGQGGTVKNLEVNIIVIAKDGYASDFVGGLCGKNSGSIVNCYSAGLVAGDYYEAGGLCGENRYGTITNSFSSAAVTGNYQTGGLCGFNMFSSISDCFSAGQVNGSFSTGGLCGENYDSNISDCFSTGKVTGNNGTGGLVGENDFGRIVNCYSTGDVNGGDFTGGLCGHDFNSISNCYATGLVTGNDYTGGLCGYGGGGISNCYATGSVTGNRFTGGLCGYSIRAVIYCYSTGSVTGFEEVGGLCGRNDSTIDDCYSTGSTTGTRYVGGLCGKNGYSITNCYSVGSTTGSFEIGGLCGTGSDIIFNSYFLDTAGPDNGFGEPLTDEQMKQQASFIDWDFSYTDGDGADWFIQIDEYPILVWQISPADIYTDGRNNFRDFAVFAQYWMREDCAIYNYYCEWADLDFDGDVDASDLFELMGYWLESGIYE